MKICHMLCAGLVIPALVALGQPSKTPQPASRPVTPAQPSRPGTDDIKKAEKAASNMMGDTGFRDTLAAQETQVWNAVKAQDWAKFESFLADDFVMPMPTGIADKAGTLAEVKKDHLASYKLSDWHAVKLGDNAGLVLYKAEQAWTGSDGKMDTSTAYCTTSWAKRDGKWVAVSHQETPVQPGAAQAK